MRIRRISIYKEFQCTGAECPASCCKGWRVPLDPATCKKYFAEKGMTGGLLQLSVRMREDAPVLRSIFGKCPFWGKDHLCRLQKKHGVEYMPRVCREFPRRLYNLGFFCEEALYLSCPEAAGLFLAHVQKGGHFYFEETEGEITYKADTTNDDEDFLMYLMAAREQLTAMVGNGCGYDSMAYLQYGQDAQNACLKGQTCPDPFIYRDIEGPRFTMDCSVLNELFFSGFYHPYLTVYSPLLHRLCEKYIFEFGILSKKNMKEANRKLAALKDELYCKMPDPELIFNGYYEYYLQTEFLDIFEDYSFLKCLLYGMAKVNMLRVLLALYAQSRTCITEEEIAKIIALYERRAPQSREELARILMKHAEGRIHL